MSLPPDIYSQDVVDEYVRLSSTKRQLDDAECTRLQRCRRVRAWHYTRMFPLSDTAAAWSEMVAASNQQPFLAPGEPLWGVAYEAICICTDASALRFTGEDIFDLVCYTATPVYCIQATWAALSTFDGPRPLAVSVPLLEKLLKHARAVRVRVHPDKRPSVKDRKQVVRLSQAFNNAHDVLKDVIARCAGR